MERLNQWLTLIANFGVIAGIIFLGLEIRQNSDISMSQVYQARLDSRLELEKIGMEPGMWVVLHRSSSGTDTETLSEFERSQVRQLHALWMAWWDNLIYQESLGLIKNEDLVPGDLAWFDSMIANWHKFGLVVPPRILEWRERRRPNKVPQ
jgi:hypothetical protein